ncbi:MAG: hypothetical protein ABIV42_06110 [Nitrosospira sp.]
MLIGSKQQKQQRIIDGRHDECGTRYADGANRAAGGQCHYLVPEAVAAVHRLGALLAIQPDEGLGSAVRAGSR